MFLGCCYWKKTSISVYREGPSLSAQILNEKSAFSPATVVFEKYDYYRWIALTLFSLPWNYPNKWTVPLSIVIFFSLNMKINVYFQIYILLLLFQDILLTWAIGNEQWAMGIEHVRFTLPLGKGKLWFLRYQHKLLINGHIIL